MSQTILAEVLPIPLATEARGHPWTVAARAFIYENVWKAPMLAALINRSVHQVRKIRSQDRWNEFREQASVRECASRHGLQLPFLLRESSLKGEISKEGDERPERAAFIRGEIKGVVAAMGREKDKASARYSRLIQGMSALQCQLDALLGLDVMKKVGTSAAIARQRASFRNRPPSNLPHLRPNAAPLAPACEPDVMTLSPLE